MQQVTPNVYAETGFRGCNCGFVVTKEGVVMIDTPMMPTEAVKWREEMARRGELRYLINTEPHGDHITGNYFFSTTVVSHQGTKDVFVASLGSAEQVRERVKAMDPAGVSLAENYQLRPPTITFNERLTLYVGDHTFELIHLVGHTPSEICVYIPQERVVFSGDNVTTVPPYLREARPIAWVESLRRLEALEVDWIVPGHGVVSGKSAIRDLITFFEEGIEAVRKAIAQGMSKEEVVEKLNVMARFPLGPQGQEIDVDRRRTGIERIYEELGAK